MNQSFIASGLDMAFSEGRLPESVRHRELTRDGLPTIRGCGLNAQYPAGGREETARARRKYWKAPWVRRVGVAA